jgi:hypothetical protein
LELYDPGSGLIDQNSGSSSPEVDAELLEDGIYTLLVESTDGTGAPHEYRLDVPCLLGKCAADDIPSDTLGYTAVDSCRIVDTRYGLGGPMSPGDKRNFHTYGDVSDQNSAAGGAPSSYPAECPFALGEHTAVHLSLTVIPLGPKGQKGTVKLWPHGGAKPISPWIYYKKAGTLKIVSTGTVKVHSKDAATPEISVRTNKKIDLIIDVLGYYIE